MAHHHLASPISFILLLLLLLQSVTPRDVPSETLCMDSYATFFQHQYTSSDGPLANTAWTWSLGALCLPNGTYEYSGPGTSGQSLYFNVLGNTSVPCSDYKSNASMYESWGVAIQYFQPGRGERSNADSTCTREDNATSCPDYTYVGETTCCSTRRCEVIALESFRFSLVDLTNPATGGVVLDHMGMPASPNDYEKCPMENGLPRLREFRLTLNCDPSAQELVVTGYNENTYCRFYVTASTALACGTQVVSPSPYPTLSSSPSFSPTASHTPTPSHSPTPRGGANAATSSTTPGNGVGPGGQFGFTVLGAFLCIGAQAFYHYYQSGALGALAAKAGMGGKGGAFPSIPSSSSPSSSATAPSSGLGGGYGALRANTGAVGGGERKSLL